MHSFFFLPDFMYSIYAHINKLNGKVYIGQSSSPKNRWKGKGIAYKGCHHFYNAIVKRGVRPSAGGYIWRYK